MWLHLAKSYFPEKLTANDVEIEIIIIIWKGRGRNCILIKLKIIIICKIVKLILFYSNILIHLLH